MHSDSPTPVPYQKPHTLSFLYYDEISYSDVDVCRRIRNQMMIRSERKRASEVVLDGR